MLQAKDPLISIILPTKNGMPLIQECLAGIFSQKTEDPFEVIVIDSGSQDGTLEMVGRYPVKLVQIPPREFGHARTRNYGARMAQGEYLVFITQDATPADSQWLQKLVNAVKSDASIAGAYSRWLARSGGHIFDHIWIEDRFVETSHIQKINEKGLSHYKENINDYVFFSDVSSCLRRLIWQKIPFDEGFQFAEDQRWARCAVEAGYAIAYVAGSRVFHSHNDPLWEHMKRCFQGGYAFWGISGTSKIPKKFPRWFFWERIKKYIVETRFYWWQIPLFLFQCLVRCVCAETASLAGYYWRSLQESLKVLCEKKWIGRSNG